VELRLDGRVENIWEVFEEDDLSLALWVRLGLGGGGQGRGEQVLARCRAVEECRELGELRFGVGVKVRRACRWVGVGAGV